MAWAGVAVAWAVAVADAWALQLQLCNSWAAVVWAWAAVAIALQWLDAARSECGWHLCARTSLCEKIVWIYLLCHDPMVVGTW